MTGHPEYLTQVTRFVAEEPKQSEDEESRAVSVEVRFFVAAAPQNDISLNHSDRVLGKNGRRPSLDKIQRPLKFAEDGAIALARGWIYQ